MIGPGRPTASGPALIVTVTVEPTPAASKASRRSSSFFTGFPSTADDAVAEHHPPAAGHLRALKSRLRRRPIGQHLADCDPIHAELRVVALGDERDPDARLRQTGVME
jgi:hypothetical protein